MQDRWEHCLRGLRHVPPHLFSCQGFSTSANRLFLIGLPGNICLYTKWSAIAVAYFNATKFFEWGDTVFLILRKKKVLFLHWFHHLLTMLYCWHATLFSYRADATGFWFAGMNLGVHAVMYLYYALAAVDVKMPYSFVITILQTTQMVVGVTLLAYTPNCKDSWRENWHGNLIAVFMYSVYLWLFATLLVNKIKSLVKPSAHGGKAKKSR